MLIVMTISGCATLGMGEFTPPASEENTRSITNSAGQITFTYEDPDADNVALAGEFNDWDTQANPMKKENGIWKTSLELPPGKYQYKFVVNGDQWKTDPDNPNTIEDGLGGENSLIEVGKETTPAKQSDGKSQPKPSGSGYPTTFTYKPLTGGKHTVYLAGDFNNWSDSATPMKEDNGIYKKTLNLKKGKYAYKFIVDGKWLTDDNADELIDDGYGGKNSIIFVGNKEELTALRKVEFSYKPDGIVNDVYVAGSFNDWNQKANEMKKQEDGSYQTFLLLKPDEYHYKFVVNGSEWITDDKAEKFVDDGFGGKNSILVVDDSYQKVTIEKGDGEILTYGIPFEQDLQTVNPLTETKIEFKTRSHPDDVEKLFLWKDKEKIPMDLVSQSNSYDYFRAIITIPDPKKEFDYCFIYEDGGKEYFLGEKGFAKNLSEIELYHYSQETVEPFFTPDWVKNGVIYQIFPERFYNGDKANDPDFTEWYYEKINIPPDKGKKLPKHTQYFHLVEDWYDIEGLKQSPYHQGEQPDYNSFYGGDIVGVHKKLDYLADLGITIIYFNPVFQAKSNHKYDAVDYKKLDPHFGTESEFKAFMADAKKKGIRVIIDVAFNHTGETFWAFQDGMKKGEKSEYYDWFEWKKWPLPDPVPADYKPIDYYECWWGFGEMPNLNFDLELSNQTENSIKNVEDANPHWDVVNYLLDDVVEYWIGEMDLDGFRLDVPNEVPFWFWKLFREKVKSLKPDAYLVGEIWTNATEFVNNDVFDATMNYAYFKDPVMRFFVERNANAKTFDRELKPGRFNYPIQAVQVMMNLIDSHDTHRFLESAGGNISKLKLAALFQMTYVGAPHIWYGDEIGMMGGHDPDCRRPFNWKYTEDPEKVALREYYEKLIEIRKENPALRTGKFETLFTQDRIYAFERILDNEKIIVIINNEESPQNIVIDTDIQKRSVIDQISGKQYHLQDGTKLQIKLDAMSGVILK